MPITETTKGKAKHKPRTAEGTYSINVNDSGNVLLDRMQGAGFYLVKITDSVVANVFRY